MPHLQLFHFFCLGQGNSTVSQYNVQLCALASELPLNNEALIATLCLTGRFKDELADQDRLTFLNDHITLTSCIDIWFTEKQREFKQSGTT